MSKSLRLLLGVVGLALVFALAACGGDDSDSDDAAAVGAQGGDAAETAAAAGEEDAGEPVDLPQRTVGYIQFTNEAEIAVRMQVAAEEAAEAIGWDFLACDGQGDPRKQGACGNTLLDRGADVILSNSIAPATTNAAIQRADKENIPWIVVGGLVPDDPKVDAIYAPDDTAMTELLWDWFVENTGGESTLAILNEFPALEALGVRAEVLNDLISQDGGGIELVGEEELDYTDVVGSIQKQVNNQLSQNPDVGAFWSITNNIPPIVQAVKSNGSRSDDWPIIVGYFADLVNLDAIRAGDAAALAEWPIEGDIWAAVDQAAQQVAREVEIPRTREELAPEYSLEFIEPTLITEENLPPEGEYPPPNADFVSYFDAKWATEFGTGGGSGSSSEEG